jgi:hypothetical protein
LSNGDLGWRSGASKRLSGKVPIFLVPSLRVRASYKVWETS